MARSLRTTLLGLELDLEYSTSMTLKIDAKYFEVISRTHGCILTHTHEHTCVIPKGFETESFPLKYNPMTF